MSLNFSIMIIFCFLIIGAISYTHRYGNRLVRLETKHQPHSHPKHRHRHTIKHQHRRHAKHQNEYDYYYPNVAAKQINYDLLLQEKEIKLINDEYDKYYDEYFMQEEEEAPTAAWITTNANNVVQTVAEQIFQENAGTHLIEVRWPDAGGAFSNFEWEDYIKRVDDGILTNEQEQSVFSNGFMRGMVPFKGLRKHTMMELLQYACDNTQVDNPAYVADPTPRTIPMPWNEACLVDLGSETAKSDLDFSYIRWEYPKQIVPMLVLFYNKFYELYGAWPAKVFDLNFYISTGFIEEKVPNNRCWQRLAGASNQYVRRLFTRIWNDATAPNPNELWELASPQGWEGDPAQDDATQLALQAKYRDHDIYLAYLLVKRRMKYDFRESGPDGKIKYFIKYAEIFYYFIDQIKNNAALTATFEVKNRNKMYLKTLLYFMNYWADESYITNEALQLQFNKNADQISPKAQYLAILDFIVFINRYLREATEISLADKLDWDDDKKAKYKLLHFFDRSSKYMWRIGRILQINDDFGPTTKFPKSGWKAFKDDGIAWNAADDQITKHNLWMYSLRWARKWDERVGGPHSAFVYGDGKKKIRGDVPLEYIWDSSKSIDPAVASFPARYHTFAPMFVEGRQIWAAMQGKYKNIADLHLTIKGVQNYIQDHVMTKKSKHAIALNAIYKTIEDEMMSRVDTLVDVSVTTTDDQPVQLTRPAPWTYDYSNPFTVRKYYTKLEAN